MRGPLLENPAQIIMVWCLTFRLIRSAVNEIGLGTKTIHESNVGNGQNPLYHPQSIGTRGTGGKGAEAEIDVLVEKGDSNEYLFVYICDAMLRTDGFRSRNWSSALQVISEYN